MASVEFTDVFIKALKPDKAKQTERRDKKVPGLVLRVSPNGTKAFALLYKNSARRARRLGLGRYGILSLSEARKVAREHLANIAAGSDPVADKQRVIASYEAQLFPSVVSEYIEDYARPNTKDWFETNRLLVREFIPYWDIARQSG